jgi:hypothetical protein
MKDHLRRLKNPCEEPFDPRDTSAFSLEARQERLPALGAQRPAKKPQANRIQKLLGAGRVRLRSARPEDAISACWILRHARRDRFGSEQDAFDVVDRVAVLEIRHEISG